MRYLSALGGHSQQSSLHPFQHHRGIWLTPDSEEGLPPKASPKRGQIIQSQHKFPSSYCAQIFTYFWNDIKTQAIYTYTHVFNTYLLKTYHVPASWMRIQLLSSECVNWVTLTLHTMVSFSMKWALVVSNSYDHCDLKVKLKNGMYLAECLAQIRCLVNVGHIQ